VNSLELRNDSRNISNIYGIDLDDSTGSEVEVGHNVLAKNVIYENLKPMENTPTRLISIPISNFLKNQLQVLPVNQNQMNVTSIR
jgi:hypothetical protein